ncbi:2-hydroxyacid dehydrogenase [Oceanobacillus polygoni]|uniref:Glyoxylate/hydroxypyruvate reductase B n=1 Tax=Oceanobacillus polygoni TaxID=1235259 RepID=A0A9X1CAU4_9BACI|nr:D-glycerate dehydrogenase [Oceanobacillus polygoni]MBP2077034.1 gluconate 2-dehydrogenase [Oceanobacillus polygoni]
MKKKIIVYERLEKPVLESLQNKYDVKFLKNIDAKTNEEFLEHLKDAEGIIGLALEVNKALLDNAPNLKIVSNVSVGYNNLDIEELSKRNIMATNTPDVLTDTVADTVFGILLAAARRIPELDHLVKSKQWIEALGPEYYGVDVHHKTIGIIGMGRIGQAIAKRAKFGFDMNVLYHSRTRKHDAEEKFDATYCSLEKLLAESDFPVLITPLTAETTGLIGKKEFQLMKHSAIFINASRGKTVVEKDLIEALQTGEIAAAGLDVFEQEPVEPNNPLLDMKNVVTLPHVGSSTYETELKMSELAARNLEAGLNGDKPPTLINPKVWELLTK